LIDPWCIATVTECEFDALRPVIKIFMRSWRLRTKSKIYRKASSHFFSVLTFFLIMVWGGVEEYSRACKKEWGVKMGKQYKNNGVRV
jgi:hypothetical protein